MKDLQIICVDDGSNDGSDTIVEEYALNDPRITLIRQENKGAGAARNNGFSKAEGKYVHFIDSDDWIELDTYEKMVNNLESSGCDTVIFQRYNYDNETHESFPSIHAFRTDNYITNFENNPSFFIRSPVVPWDKITRRSVIENNNIKYDEIACANDRTFYFHLIKSCRSIMVCRDLLIYYRVNNSKSTIGTNRSINFDAHFTAYRSTIIKYSESSDEIKRMLADVCFTDFFIFFDKSEIRFKEKIWKQLRDFFENEDLSIFHGDFSKYSWGKRLEETQLFSECPSKYLFEPLLTEYQYKSMEKLFEMPKEEVIVSLTSFPARINTVNLTLKSILFGQTVRPDRVILWLADSQFPEKEAELPPQLLILKKYGLEIRFCDDLKPHKKYYYTMLENPDSIIITIDDDVLYSSDTLESLLRSYVLFPSCISAGRVHRISFFEGKTLPYNLWNFNDNGFYLNPSFRALATGVGGILYPPHILPSCTFDIKAIEETCLFADDLWLKVNELIAEIPTVLASPTRSFRYVDGTQESALWKSNKNAGGNDTQLDSILGHFKGTNDFHIEPLLLSEITEKTVTVSVLVDCSDSSVEQVYDITGVVPDDYEVVLYNVPLNIFDVLHQKYCLIPKIKLLPHLYGKLPLYGAASVARGKYVVPITFEGIKDNNCDFTRLLQYPEKPCSSADCWAVPRKAVCDLRLSMLSDNFSKNVLYTYLCSEENILKIEPGDISGEYSQCTRSALHAIMQSWVLQ